MIGLLFVAAWLGMILPYAIWRATRHPMYFEWRPLGTWLSFTRQKWYQRWWWNIKWYSCLRWTERDFGPVKGDTYRDTSGNEYVVTGVGATKAVLDREGSV